MSGREAGAGVGGGDRLTEGGVHQLVASEGDHCAVDCPTPTLQIISLRRVPGSCEIASFLLTLYTSNF